MRPRLYGSERARSISRERELPDSRERQALDSSTPSIDRARQVLESHDAWLWRRLGATYGLIPISGPALAASSSLLDEPYQRSEPTSALENVSSPHNWPPTPGSRGRDTFESVYTKPLHESWMRHSASTLPLDFGSSRVSGHAPHVNTEPVAASALHYNNRAPSVGRRAVLESGGAWDALADVSNHVSKDGPSTSQFSSTSEALARAIQSASTKDLEAQQLREELRRTDDHRRLCLEEYTVAREQCERLRAECSGLRQELTASELRSRGLTLSAQRHFAEQSCGVTASSAELRGALRPCSAGRAEQLALAASFRNAERGLLQAWSEASAHATKASTCEQDGCAAQPSSASPQQSLDKACDSYADQIRDAAAILEEAADEVEARAEALAGAQEEAGSPADARSRAAIESRAPPKTAAALAVHRLAALVAGALRTQALSLHDPRRTDECARATASAQALMVAGRTLLRSATVVLKRVKRMGLHLSAGHKVRCTRVADAEGRAECAVWGGDWSPLNAELPLLEHAAASWHFAAMDARASGIRPPATAGRRSARAGAIEVSRFRAGGAGGPGAPPPTPTRSNSEPLLLPPREAGG